MDGNRIQFRLNAKKERHQKAIEKLRASNKDYKEFIIDAILAYEEGTTSSTLIADTFREILKEELRNIIVSPKEQSLLQEEPDGGSPLSLASNHEDDKIGDAAMGMLSAFESME